MAQWLDAEIPQPRQVFPVSRRYQLSVGREAEHYRIDFGDGTSQTASSPEGAGRLCLGRLHDLALAALADYTKVHAGDARWGQSRLLVVGPGRSGKTTLMTRLLYEGFAVHGDEMVLLRDGTAVSYPRRFGIRQPTLALVPQVNRLAPEWAREPNTHGYQVFALDPRQAGFAWRIEPGPADVIAYLEPGHGQRSALRPCPQHAMAQRLMAQSTPPAGGRSQWIADVCAILVPARCFILRLGELASAVSALQEVLARETQ